MKESVQKKYRGASAREYNDKIKMYNSLEVYSPAERAAMVEEAQKQIRAFEMQKNEISQSKTNTSHVNREQNNRATAYQNRKKKTKMTLRGKAVIAATLVAMGYLAAKPIIRGATNKIDDPTIYASMNDSLDDNNKTEDFSKEYINKEDKITYVVDFCEYDNPYAKQNIAKFAESDNVDTFAFKIRRYRI